MLKELSRFYHRISVFRIVLGRENQNRSSSKTMNFAELWIDHSFIFLNISRGEGSEAGSVWSGEIIPVKNFNFFFTS